MTPNWGHDPQLRHNSGILDLLASRTFDADLRSTSAAVLFASSFDSYSYYQDHETTIAINLEALSI